jgi:HlyD family secretion protein
VNIGHSDGKKSEVLDGLQAGDQVILHPPDSVADQARVSHR